MPQNGYSKVFCMFFFCFLIAGCITTRQTTRQTHEHLNSVLWIQTSIEYRLSSIQAYTKARGSFDRAIADPSWTAALEQKDTVGKYRHLPPAVILDIDETVLDNSPFEARLITKNIDFNSGLWREWINEAAATPIPGAKEFINYVLDKGVAIFFVTNRGVETKKGTLENLKKVINPSISEEQVLCKRERKGWSSDKSSRRAFVAANYRVLLLIGDDYNDFVGLGKLAPEQRLDRGLSYSEYWLDKWVLLPNCLYGSWERALYNYDYSISDSEKLRIKYEYLRQQ